MRKTIAAILLASVFVFVPNCLIDDDYPHPIYVEEHHVPPVCPESCMLPPEEIHDEFGEEFYLDSCYDTPDDFAVCEYYDYYGCEMISMDCDYLEVCQSWVIWEQTILCF